MGDRVNFLYTEVKVYPASVEEEPYSGGYKWDTLLIAGEPVLATYENIGLGSVCSIGLYSAINEWINQEMLNKGKELVYQNCPKAPEA